MPRREQAVKKSTNKKCLFLPPLVGVVVMLFVFGFFNSQYLSAKIAYALSSHNIQATSNADKTLQDKPVDKSAEPTITINKIDVTAPVIYDAASENETIFQELLRKGVVHYPNTTLPGQTGNVVIFGHSSGQWWAPGDYKFVFTLLDKLGKSDKIFLEFEGTRYTYQVTDTRIVLPNEVSVLQDTPTSKLTLITCYPVGSNAKRLIIDAEQIIPVPKEKQKDNTLAVPVKPSTKIPVQTLPSRASSFWDIVQEAL